MNFEERLASLELRVSKLEEKPHKNFNILSGLFSVLYSLFGFIWPFIKNFGPWILVFALAFVQFKGCDLFKPKPEPVPVPPIVFPDDAYKLSKFTYDAVNGLVKIEKSRKEGAKLLINSMNVISAAIAAGTIKDLESALKKTAEANRAALQNFGIPLQDWDGFFSVLQEELYKLYTNTNPPIINNVSDFRNALLEIIRGLEAIK